MYKCINIIIIMVKIHGQVRRNAIKHFVTPPAQARQHFACPLAGSCRLTYDNSPVALWFIYSILFKFLGVLSTVFEG